MENPHDDFNKRYGLDKRFDFGCLPLGLALFGLIFFVFGSFHIPSKIHNALALCNRARDWVETPAKILDLKLEHHYGRRGSVSYSIAILYQYEFNGATFTSERFTPFLFVGEGKSGYSRQNYLRYKPLFESKTPILCYVNPGDPAEAIIDRTVRFKQVVGARFFGLLATFLGSLPILIGVGMMVKIKEWAAFACIPLAFFVVPAAVSLAYTGWFFYQLLPFQPWPWHVWLAAIPALVFSTLAVFRYNARPKPFSGDYVKNGKSV